MFCVQKRARWYYSTLPVCPATADHYAGYPGKMIQLKTASSLRSPSWGHARREHRPLAETTPTAFSLLARTKLGKEFHMCKVDVFYVNSDEN